MASNHARGKTDDNMKGLISSIREQTTKLKVRTRQSNLLLSKASRLLPPQGPSRPSKETSVFTHSNPESSRLSPELPEALKNDSSYSKQLIENLLKDNKQFHEEIEDYKRVLQIMHAKCLDLKKELELERLKNSEMDLLRKQLQQAYDRVQEVTRQNLMLKDKCLKLAEFLRQMTFETTEQEKEDQVLMERVVRENAFLRDLLQVSRASQPKLQEIEAALSIEEAALTPIAEYDKLVQSYREQRFARKSKSIGNVSKKNYLLDLSGTPSGSQNVVWDSFFGKTDMKSKKK